MEQPWSVTSRFDGREIACLTIAPEGMPLHGVVQLAHGMCEHKERYVDWMRYLTQQGFAAVISDHRGHGGSVADEAELGYFGDTQGDAIVDDLWQVTCAIRQRFPGQKVMLFGHSMGSLVVRKYIQTHDEAIDRLVVCGSPSENRLVNVALALCKVIGALRGERYRSELIKRLSTGNGSKRFAAEQDELSWLTSDQAVRDAYRQNPYCSFTFTINGYLNLFHLVKHVYEPARYQVKNPALPILFVAGADDPVILSPRQWEDAQAFLRRLGYTNVSGKLYEGMRHEILNEKERLRVYQDVVEFLKK